MILTQNIIKKVDLDNVYAIGNSLIVPVIISIDKALMNNARYIKTCVLPKNIETKFNSRQVYPSNLNIVTSQAENSKNKKSIKHTLFGKYTTPDFTKRILSKNSITTGQGLYEKQDLFISTDEIVSNNNSITIYSILDVNNVKSILSEGLDAEDSSTSLPTLNTQSTVLDRNIINAVNNTTGTGSGIANFPINTNNEDINLAVLNLSNDIAGINLANFVSDTLKLESSHQFVISILNKDNVVLDFSVIDQADNIKIDDYYDNIDSLDFENTILQYLNTFSDSLDIAMKPYVFSGLQKNIISGPDIVYNTSILKLLEDTLDTINAAMSITLRFEILNNTFSINLFNVTTRRRILSTITNFEINNIVNSLSTELLKENIVQSIREYFFISENPLTYTVSLETSYSNTSISRDYYISKQEGLQLYRDYEEKNRQVIIENEFRNKFVFSSLDNDSRRRKIIKITCNSLREDFIRKTEILNDSLKVRFEFILPTKDPMPIPITYLFLDDELTKDNNIISITNDSSLFLYNTLFNDPNTNTFYFSGNLLGSQLNFENFQMNVYVDGILIDKEQTQSIPRIDVLTENFRRFNLPSIPGSLINVAGQDNISIPNITTNITNTLNKNFISPVTTGSVGRSFNFEIGNLQSFTNSLNVLNYNLEFGTDSLNLSKVLENTLFEIKVNYMLKSKKNVEFVYYTKAIDIYDSTNSSFKIATDDINVNSALSKNVSVRSIVFDEGKLEKIFDENALPEDKESIFTTLNNMNNSLYSFYIKKFEKHWFKNYSEVERKLVYKDIFKVYENQSLENFTISENSTTQNELQNKIQEDTNVVKQKDIIPTLKNNLLRNRNNKDIVNTSNIVLNECLNYKKRDIKLNDAISNIQFNIRKGQVFLEKLARSKKYNLKINIDKYEILKDLKSSKIEIAHHINLGFYKDSFNNVKIDENIVSDMTFLTLPNSLYINKKMSFSYENNSFLIRSLEKDNVNLKFDDDYYNKCIEYWNGNGKDLYLNLIIEKYVIRIIKDGKETILSYNNLIPASKNSIEYIQKYSITKNNSKIENLGINLLGGNLFKPNFNILYN